MSDKLAFIIAPIGDEKSQTRKRSDQILRYILEPVVLDLGFKPIRADKIAKPGMITTQIVEHILSDPLVIADLTDQNPNVMYELALRHAIKKPTVQLIEQSQLLPFDVSGNRTIKLDHTDLDSVNRVMEELRKQIQEAIENPDLVDSPISQAIMLNSLKRADNPVSNTLSEISLSMNDINSRLAKIEQYVFLNQKTASDSLPSKIGVLNVGIPPRVEVFDKEIFDEIFGGTAWQAVLAAARDKQKKASKKGSTA